LPKSEFSTYGQRTLPAALALADLYAREDAWRPGEADLDIEPEQAQGVAEAFKWLGVEPPDFIIAASGQSRGDRPWSPSEDLSAFRGIPQRSERFVAIGEVLSAVATGVFVSPAL